MPIPPPPALFLGWSSSSSCCFFRCDTWLISALGKYCFPVVGSLSSLVPGTVPEYPGYIRLSSSQAIHGSHVPPTPSSGRFLSGFRFSWYRDSRRSVPGPGHTLCACQVKIHTFGKNLSCQNHPSRFRSSSSRCGWSLGLAS